MAMTVNEKDGKLIIILDLETPSRSASGKTLVVASTHGNKRTDVLVDGQELYIGLNAYIYPKRG